MNNNVKQYFKITINGKDESDGEYTVNSDVNLPDPLYPSTIIHMVLALLTQTEKCITGLLKQTGDEVLIYLRDRISENSYVYLKEVFQEKMEK